MLNNCKGWGLFFNEDAPLRKSCSRIWEALSAINKREKTLKTFCGLQKNTTPKQGFLNLKTRSPGMFSGALRLMLLSCWFKQPLQWEDNTLENNKGDLGHILAHFYLKSWKCSLHYLEDEICYRLRNGLCARTVFLSLLKKMIVFLYAESPRKQTNKFYGKKLNETTFAGLGQNDCSKESKEGRTGLEWEAKIWENTCRKNVQIYGQNFPFFSLFLSHVWRISSYHFCHIDGLEEVIIMNQCFQPFWQHSRQP